MERPSNVQSKHKPRTRPRKDRERGAPGPPKTQRPKSPGAGGHPETPSVRKEKLEEEEEVRMSSTVVDIDRVRDNGVKDESLGLLEAAGQEDGLKRKNLGVFEWLLMVFVLTLVLLFLPFSIWFCVKVVREHERAVIFRLGHLLQGKPKGPGLFFCLPLLDVCHIVDIRLRMLTVPLHVVVTKDLARLELSAVCYYQIENVALCSAALASLTSVLQSLLQAAIRDVLAQHTFSHILLHRRRVGEQIQTAVDSVTCRWGIRVERVDIDELSFPAELQKRLTTEAKTQQQLREQSFPLSPPKQVKASESEIAAWDMLRASLRYLHPAMVFPLPPDLLSVNSDFSSLPPPPSPAVEEEMTAAEPETDSTMM